MSQSPSSLKKILDSPNEIDPVTFYTSSSVPFPTKLSTISPVNTTETSPLTPQAPIDLNSSAPSYQLGPLSTILADHFRGRSSTDDTGEDDVPLRCALQRRIVHITTKGKEKNRRRRRSSDMVMELPTDDVVDVTIEVSKNKTSTVKKTDTTKGKENDSQKKREPSKRKRETSPVLKQNSEQGLGTKRNKNDKEVNKQAIIDNLHLQKVLEERVFDTEILTKPGMGSLADLVELQSWSHLFMKNLPFYMNNKFESSTIM
ncbi:hypothetical protein KY290_003780 [Solanum tuberosum]|uniref:Ulp1 protease family, C-terminal catalytic domain containing protein n=1 Tax=Solanum tuberosum TaxID=4113 RepID=A0ABQ7WTU6_SOLTU|nr:hypothetical protein KY290_003780 [Solanum tuberosum]